VDRLGAGIIRFEVVESNLRSLNRLWLNPPLVVPIKQVGSLPEILEKYPNIRFLRVETRFAQPELVDAAHAVGLKLYTFTKMVENMDNDRFYKRALDAGVDGLMLGDIENLRRFLREYALQEIEADLPTKMKSP
jgi:glycerophosphoryl diester phosphodiesterase